MSDQPVIGVCWFDDPDAALGAWACRSDGEPFRVNGTQSLSSDVLWVTNLNYSVYRRLNLIQVPHITDAQYFRTSLTLLANEIGLYAEPDRACHALSRVFARVTREGHHHLGLGMSPGGYRYTKLIADRIMPRAHRLAPVGPHVAEIAAAFTQAMQQNQGMSGVQRPSGAVAYPFLFPRGAFARWLLSQPMPASSAWQEIKTRGSESVFGVQGGELISGTRAVRSRLAELGAGHAVLLRVRVLDMEPFYRPFASFGAGMRTPRGWAALPEILELSNYAKVAISGGFRTKAEPLNLPGLDFGEDEFSFSRGLYWENVWTALASALNGGKEETSLGAYLRAYDRLACGRAAAALARMRYTVGSYGTGRVMVFLRPGEMPEAARYALDMGLLPPGSSLQKEALGE